MQAPLSGLPEVREKMAKIRAYTDAIDRAKEALAVNPSFNAALNIQSLERQRRELRATLPPLALVTN